jgi:hypothetical protein
MTDSHHHGVALGSYQFQYYIICLTWRSQCECLMFNVYLQLADLPAMLTGHMVLL